jgi:hypothetical protein
MYIDKALEILMEKYPDYTDVIIGLSFTRLPFADDFRDSVGLKNVADFIKASYEQMKMF